MKTIVLALMVTGCASGPRPAPSLLEHVPEGVRPPLRIVDRDFGGANSARSARFQIPFGLKQDGTALLLIALDEARNAGAAFVGDLTVAVAFKWQGTTVECSSRVVLNGDPALAASAPQAEETLPAYGTNVNQLHPRRITLDVDEQALQCHEGAISHHVHEQKTMDDRLDVEQDRAVYGAQSREDDLVQVYNEATDVCERVRVQRRAERYDYEIKLGFIPPDLAYLTRRYADRALRTTAPVCYRLAEATEPLYRLTGTAYFRRDVARAASKVAGDAMLGNMKVRENVSADGARQRCELIGRKDGCDHLDGGESGWSRKQANQPREWNENGPWIPPQK